MSKRLVLNSISGTASYLVSIAVAFIMSPVYIHALGNRDYGLWELVMSVIGYMGLLDLGIGPALIRFVSVADGKHDRDDLQQTISTSFAFFTFVGVTAILGFVGLGYSPELIAGGEIRDIANLGTVFFLLGINAGLLFPQQVFTATLLGVQRHFFINSVRILLMVSRAVLTYYLLMRFEGRGLIIMALLEPIFTAIQFILFAGAVFLDKSIPGITLATIKASKAKEMLAFGAKSATMQIASRLQNQSVPLIIANMIGLGQIVYFIMPNRLVNYAKGMAQAIGYPLTPYFGESVGKGDQSELLKSWLNTTLALQIISLAMPVVIFFVGESFLKLWIGQEYADAGRVVLYILLVGLAVDSLATNSFRILTAQGKHGKSALTWFVLSALSIPVGIWGAQVWGLMGVSLGTTGVTVLANLVTVSLACSVMKVSLASYFQKTLLRIILPLIILGLVLCGMGILFPIGGYLNMFLHLLLGGGIYILAVWQLTLSADVRDRLGASIRLKLAVLR